MLITFKNPAQLPLYLQLKWLSLEMDFLCPLSGCLILPDCNLKIKWKIPFLELETALFTDRQQHCCHGQHIPSRASSKHNSRLSCSPAPGSRSCTSEGGKKRGLRLFLPQVSYSGLVFNGLREIQCNYLMGSSLSKCFHSLFKYSAFLTPIITLPCSKGTPSELPSGMRTDRCH